MPSHLRIAASRDASEGVSLFATGSTGSVVCDVRPLYVLTLIRPRRHWTLPSTLRP